MPFDKIEGVNTSSGHNNSKCLFPLLQNFKTQKAIINRTSRGTRQIGNYC